MYFSNQLSTAKAVTRIALAAGIIVVGIQNARANADNHASKLFTSDIAQKILGGPVSAGSANEEADTVNGKTWVSRANYMLQSNSASAPQLSLMLRHATSKDEAAGIFKSSKSTFHGADVSGLGVPAYRTAMPAQLNVLKGPHWLIISAGTFKAPDNLAQEKLARELLPKISEQ